MPMLTLTPDELLETTRSVRKRLDLTRPVEREILEQCLALAQQAPSGSNSQGWHFLVVTEAAKRAAIGELYRKSWYPYSAQRTARRRHWWCYPAIGNGGACYLVCAVSRGSHA